MAEKEKIYLTDITLHTRNFRDTKSFQKVADKGRMYKAGSEAFVDGDNGNYGISLLPLLPLDLQERYHRGEIEFVIPKEGLALKFADDLVEKLIKEEKTERHRKTPRARVLQPDTEELQ